MFLVNPFEKYPDEIYRTYQKFRRRNELAKAYRCLENLVKQVPDDPDLLSEIVELALDRIRDPNLARPWVIRRVKLFSYWRDYALLSEIEAASGDLRKAKENLVLATKLQKRQGLLMDTRREVTEALDRARNVIRLQEHNRRVARVSSQAEDQPAVDAVKDVKGVKQRGVGPRRDAVKPSATTAEKRQPADQSEARAATAPPIIQASASYRAPLRFAPPDLGAMNAMLNTQATLRDCRLRVEYAHLDVQRGFDDLLCVNAIRGVERYWYQVETAKKVLKYFHGRVLLCDEVGLGKTIEAGMLMKEYLLRGMVKNILILAPAPLVSQWQEEMAQKFDVVFATTDDPLFSADPDGFWRGSFIIASIHTAKSSKNFSRVAANFYDLVVVDEAHHLKNRNTLNWKLVNEIQKRFIFLLTATPVQNHLVELFNLITLLKPGQFRTERLFKHAYVQRGDSRKPANKEQLRELLRDVMIRNTRSAIDLKLPRRFASTVRLEPYAVEQELYRAITDYARTHSVSSRTLVAALAQAGREQSRRFARHPFAFALRAIAERGPSA